MKKLLITFICSAIVGGGITLLQQNKELKREVKYYKNQNRMSNEAYDKYKAESTLRLKKQVDSLININHRKKPGSHFIDSVTNEWKVVVVPASQTN